MIPIVEELVSITPGINFLIVGLRRIDIFQPEEDVQGLLAVDYIACTGGWYVAMEAACREVGDEWFMEWYNALDWMESDEFDCDLMAELKTRVLETGEETRHAYYEWLVKGEQNK